MDATKSIFYRLFQAFPSLFFELIGHSPQEANAYDFLSVELKETERCIENVFLPMPGLHHLPIFFVDVHVHNDPNVYFRFVSDMHLYFYQYHPVNDWQAVMIYPSRAAAPPDPFPLRSILSSSQVQRVYLDELGDPDQQSIGVSLMQFAIAPEVQAATQAKRLIERVEQEDTGILSRDEIMELITTISDVSGHRGRKSS
jgi:predicted transposase/invertase (TIGR01784 family)